MAECFVKVVWNVLTKKVLNVEFIITFISVYRMFMDQLLMVLCALLVSMSLIFIVIEVRANFDRSFLIFGIVNLLICSFCIIDILFQPSKQILHWTLMQHLIASFFPPFLLWHVRLIKNNIDLCRFN